MGQFRGLSLLLILFQISVDILFYRLYHTSIDIVLSTNTVVYVDDALDISDKVISELNK